MTRTRTGALVSFAAITLGGISSLGLAQTSAERFGLNPAAIGEAAGVEATTTPDGVVRIGWSRDDVAVQVDGMAMKPFAGLGSWAAFHVLEEGAMVMGDTVVFQDEVTPAIDAAFEHEMEVTALHNHFFYDRPKVYFMHIGGSGDPQKLAAGVKAVWDAIRAVRKDNPQPADSFPGRAPDPNQSVTAVEIEQILGQQSETKDGVVKISVPRVGRMHGIEIGGSMGLSTWAAFSGSDEYAAVDGDFIMSAAEVQPVLRALRQHKIHIVALHNHMIGEEPAFYFTHFWGKGAAKELAEAIKNTLEAQQNVEQQRSEGVEH